MTSLQDTIDASTAQILNRLDVFAPEFDEIRAEKEKPKERSRTPRRFPSMSPPTRREYQERDGDQFKKKEIDPREARKYALNRRGTQHRRSSVARRRRKI
jgi:hypothetical protein